MDQVRLNSPNIVEMPNWKIGTCVPLCYAAFLFKVIGLLETKIIFVESFCRVDQLSLTGKLLYLVSDRFIVQWQKLLTLYPRAEYLGDGRSS